MINAHGDFTVENNCSFTLMFNDTCILVVNIGQIFIDV